MGYCSIIHMSFTFIHLTQFHQIDPLKWYTYVVHIIATCSYCNPVMIPDGLDIPTSIISSKTYINNSNLYNLSKETPNNIIHPYQHPCHHHYSHHNHCYWYHRPPPTANHRPRPSSKRNWSDRPAGVPPGIFPQEFNLGFYSLSPQAYTYIYSDVHQCVHNVMKDVPYWIVYSEHLSDTNRWDILPVTVIVSSTPPMDESISWNNTV